MLLVKGIYRGNLSIRHDTETGACMSNFVWTECQRLCQDLRAQFRQEGRAGAFLPSDDVPLSHSLLVVVTKIPLPGAGSHPRAQLLPLPKTAQINGGLQGKNCLLSISGSCTCFQYQVLAPGQRVSCTALPCAGLQ